MIGSAVSDRNDLYTAINNERPYRSYIKTELGKVFITILDVFSGKPEGLLLEGDPRKKDKGCIIDFWSDREDAFFRQKNSLHLSRGTIVAYERPVEAVKERTMEEFSDDELREILSKPYYSLKSALNKTESIGLVFRFLGLAQEMEKSDAFVTAIESRLSELQSMDEPQTIQSEE